MRAVGLEPTTNGLKVRSEPNKFISGDDDRQQLRQQSESKLVEFDADYLDQLAARLSVPADWLKQVHGYCHGATEKERDRILVALAEARDGAKRNRSN